MLSHDSLTRHVPQLTMNLFALLYEILDSIRNEPTDDTLWRSILVDLEVDKGRPRSYRELQ